MLRSIAFKALQLAKGVALLGGFAVGLALIFGVATTALAAVPGDPFRLGQINTIDALTTLTGSNARGAMLKVDNDSSATSSRALDLRVEPGRAPINVNADAGRAANLNADKLDGLNAEDIGVNGLEDVVAVNQGNSDSPKSVFVDCPDGKVIVGADYRTSFATTGSFPNETQDVVVSSVGANPDFTRLFVTAHELRPTTDSWAVSAEAICATEGTP